MNIKRSFLGVLRYFFSSNYRNFRFVRRLCVFDAGYYASRSKSGCSDKIDPLWQYLQTRCADSSKFVPSKSHWAQLPDPHPLFDTSFYIRRYFPKGLRGNPFAHYLRKGWKKGFHPGPLFDPEHYCARFKLQKSDGDPLTHYTRHGAPQGCSPGPYFDIDWYLDKNPVLQSAKKEIAKHYKIYGAGEGKSPVPVFDPDYYLSQLENGEEAEADPISHYITTADHADCRPGRWFDPDFYRQQCRPGMDRSLALAHYLSEGVFKQMYPDRRVQQLAKKPLISVIVPVYNPEICFLNTCIRSVLYQAYPHWELCLADDCSTREEIKELLEEWTKKDTRIKVTYLDKNGGISAATNAAAALAKGQYLGFLDNDDELAVDCLYHVAETINRQDADLIYSDEDLIGEDGRRFSVFRKPNFNLELLFSHNYITHFVVVSKNIFKQTGGFDSLYDGAQDFDLMLRLTEHTDRVCHIPRILYHWRAARTSTSINHDQKDYAHTAGKRALEAALARRGIDAVVEDTDVNFFYRLNYLPNLNKKISVLLWSDSYSQGDVSRIVSLAADTTYRNSEFILVSDHPDVSGWIRQSMSESALKQRIVLHSVVTGASKAHALHQAALSADGEFLVFVDASITGVADDWLEQLLGPLAFDDTAIVCGRVSYDGADGQTYTVPVVSDESTEYFNAFLHSSSRHMNGLHCPQQVSFCGWEVTLIDRRLYLEVGGFAFQQFPEQLAMADLALKVAEREKRIVYTPYARVEKSTALMNEKSRPVFNEAGEPGEKSRFQHKWREPLQCFDPFYNRGILDDNNISGVHFLFWLTGGERDATLSFKD